MLAQIIGNDEPIPTTIERLTAWIEADVTIREILFGDALMVLRVADRILVVLKRGGHLFTAYLPIHFALLFWAYHVGLRRASNGEGTAYLERLLQQIEGEQPIPLTNFHSEIQRQILLAAGSSSSSPRGPADESSGRPFKKPKISPAGPKFIKRWMDSIEAAQQAVAPGTLPA
jgi:hypothetical protein